MSDTIDLVSTSQVGGSTGTPFVDCPPTGHLFSSTINKIAIRTGSSILSLRVFDPQCFVAILPDLTLWERLDLLRVE